ncbi:hypothetical protein Taro_054976 [Colocasia esculenta]|uniref:Aminotransferase-like plant mobile domain-containing protein n=1 Tax=Colocasia esculenta TaxID=4460 RepID=A0A843XQ97_COLES|nr:hypothetical protein [Colocasia esculenta]
MEGEKNPGEGSSWRKRQVERRSSRRQTEAPPVEEEVDTAEMDVEEEVEAPTVNVEEEQKKRAKAMKSGEMRAQVSWVVVLAVFLAFPPFQRERVEEMGFSGVFRMERMRVDSALTQALRSRWDVEAAAFIFPWGHMIPSLEDVSRITGLRIYGRPVSGYTYPCYHDLAERLLELPVEHRSSLVPRVPLQESLGLFDVGKVAGESEDEHLDRLTRVSRRELASEPRAQADLDLRRFLVLFLGRLFFATRGDAVYCRFLPLLEDLDSHNLEDQLERLQEAIDSYPYLDARPYFGRSVWLHAFNLVLPLHLHLSQRSLGLRQSVVEFPVRDQFRRPGQSFRGLHDTTDWRERAKEQIDNWECRGKAVKSDATTDDAYLQAYALKYSGKVFKSARHQVDVTGKIASLRALLYSAVQDREAAQRQTAELRRELERVRSTGAGGASSSRAAGGASSSRAAGGSPSLLEAQLAGAVLRAEEAQRHLEERSERDQLHIRAEAAEAQVAEVTKELAVLRV